MHQVTCMRDRDEQCCHACDGCARTEFERLIEEENNDKTNQREST